MQGSRALAGNSMERAASTQPPPHPHLRPEPALSRLLLNPTAQPDATKRAQPYFCFV